MTVIPASFAIVVASLGVQSAECAATATGAAKAAIAQNGIKSFMYGPRAQSAQLATFARV